MKRFIIIALALCLVIAMVVPASAVTTGKWDFQAGYQHAQDTAKDMLEQETAEELPEESAATTMRWDLSKAQPSINKAVTEIVTAPTFSWSDWLARILENLK